MKWKQKTIRNQKKSLSFCSTESCCKHNPHSTYIFWIRNNFNSDCMSSLISSSKKNFSSNFVLVNMGDHSICFKMCELNWKGLKCMSFWYIILDSMLKLLGSKWSTSNSLVFIIWQCSRKKIAELIVPLSWDMMFVFSDCTDFVFQDCLKKLLFIRYVLKWTWH